MKGAVVSLRDWARTFVESPLAGAIAFNPGPSRIQVFDGKQWIFTASAEQEKLEPGLWDKIESKRYATICPHCGAPHNPREERCEYCGGYMKGD